MTMLEDRVRRALRETAEEVTHRDVPPLQLPDGGGRGAAARSWLARGRQATRWPGWFTPLAAAAAVAAVLAATLAVTGTLSGHRPARRDQQAAPLPGVPRYYVGVADARAHRDWPQQVVIRATATGQIVATMAPPRPENTFLMVAAASGVGRYVLAAQRMAFKRVRLASPPGLGSGAKHQRSLAIPVPPARSASTSSRSAHQARSRRRACWLPWRCRPARI